MSSERMLCSHRSETHVRLRDILQFFSFSWRNLVSGKTGCLDSVPEINLGVESELNFGKGRREVKMKRKTFKDSKFVDLSCVRLFSLLNFPSLPPSSCIMSLMVQRRLHRRCKVSHWQKLCMACLTRLFQPSFIWGKYCCSLANCVL